MNESNRPDPLNTTPDPLKSLDFDTNQPAAQSNQASIASEKIAATAPLDAGWERATLEKLAFASLNEQKATRRWKTFVRLSWLAFFIALVWLVLHRGTPASDASVPHTAVVAIKGEIADGASDLFISNSGSTGFDGKLVIPNAVSRRSQWR